MNLFILHFILRRSLAEDLRRILMRFRFPFFFNGIYVLGDLWEYWRTAFPNMSIVDMFDFFEFNIDDERSQFLRSLVYRGSWPLT
jgi:hypothetical protein